MAVIINEFEVGVEPPARPEPSGPAPAPSRPDGPGAAPALSPLDIRDILAQQAQRELRRWAH